MLFRSNEWNFRVTEICLLETIKKSSTRQVQITLQAGSINEQHIEFFKKNLKKNPGRTRLKLIMVDQIEKLMVQMKTTEKGIEMNDELADFLEKNPLIEVQVDAV